MASVTVAMNAVCSANAPVGTRLWSLTPDVCGPQRRDGQCDGLQVQFSWRTESNWSETDTVVLQVLSDILQTVSCVDVVTLILLNLSAAFGTADHGCVTLCCAACRSVGHTNSQHCRRLCSVVWYSCNNR